MKHLARYLTGGPISDRRLIEHQDGQITFWARYRKREAYLRCCRQVLQLDQRPTEPAETPGEELEEAADERTSDLACPQCQTAMQCISQIARPS